MRRRRARSAALAFALSVLAACASAPPRAQRDTLRAAMEAEGFTVYENEWWHFDFAGWERYPVLDLPFESLPHESAAPCATDR